MRNILCAVFLFFVPSTLQVANVFALPECKGILSSAGRLESSPMHEEPDPEIISPIVQASAEGLFHHSVKFLNGLVPDTFFVRRTTKPTYRHPPPSEFAFATERDRAWPIEIAGLVDDTHNPDTEPFRFRILGLLSRADLVGPKPKRGKAILPMNPIINFVELIVETSEPNGPEIKFTKGGLNMRKRIAMNLTIGLYKYDPSNPRSLNSDASSLVPYPQSLFTGPQPLAEAIPLNRPDRDRESWLVLVSKSESAKAEFYLVNFQNKCNQRVRVRWLNPDDSTLLSNRTAVGILKKSKFSKP